MSRPVWIGLALVATWAVSTLVATTLGSVSLPAAEAARALGWRLGLSGPPSPMAGIIVWELRLPRVLLAAIVGGGLAVVGVGMQALVRNPLAEPYILGVSGGASAGVSLFYLGFLPAALVGDLTVGMVAFTGALGTMAIVYLVASDGARVSTARLLLAGVAMQALLGALTSFVIFASPQPQKLQTMLFLLLGTFSGASWGGLVLPALAALGGTATLWLLARPMDALLTGEEPAQTLGVPVEALKRTLIAVTALVTGVLVAAAGIIGFVGLIIPHAVRFISGVSHRRLVPLSFAAGAVFMVWADVAARMLLAQQELPVGVLTAICGVPFFLALLRRKGPLG
jgi:iron complex transport system permease protein